MGTPPDNAIRVTRVSDCEISITRSFNAPARIVYQAWTRPDLFMRWWAPKSMGMPILSCEMDVRTGGKYSLTFGLDDGETWTFYGKYLDVVPDARIVWTNDEGEEGSVTTVTFEEKDGVTFLTYRDLFPSRQAFEESVGQTDGLPEQFRQLDDLLLTLDASA